MVIHLDLSNILFIQKVALVEVFFPTDYKVDYGEIHLSDIKTKNISKTQIFLKDNENIKF